MGACRKPSEDGTCNPSCGSCEADLGPSTSYPWHHEGEDCRAVREPVTPEAFRAMFRRSGKKQVRP